MISIKLTGPGETAKSCSVPGGWKGVLLTALQQPHVTPVRAELTLGAPFAEQRRAFPQGCSSRPFCLLFSDGRKYPEEVPVSCRRLDVELECLMVGSG